jgi:DNA-binding response OmpR family regulator
MRVLLVEPDRVLAATYMRILQRQGCEVQHAISAQMAVQLADTATPDVVVIELQMLRHNGVEFLYEFRSYSEWLHIPVIIHSFVPVRELAMTKPIQQELGVRQVLYKPTTSLQKLCTAIRQVVPVVS